MEGIESASEINRMGFNMGWICTNAFAYGLFNIHDVIKIVLGPKRKAFEFLSRNFEPVCNQIWPQILSFLQTIYDSFCIDTNNL